MSSHSNSRSLLERIDSPAELRRLARLSEAA